MACHRDPPPLALRTRSHTALPPVARSPQVPPLLPTFPAGPLDASAASQNWRRPFRPFSVRIASRSVAHNKRAGENRSRCSPFRPRKSAFLAKYSPSKVRSAKIKKRANAKGSRSYAQSCQRRPFCRKAVAVALGLALARCYYAWDPSLLHLYTGL